MFIGCAKPKHCWAVIIRVEWSPSFEDQPFLIFCRSFWCIFLSLFPSVWRTMRVSPQNESWHRFLPVEIAAASYLEAIHLKSFPYNIFVSIILQRKWIPWFGELLFEKRVRYNRIINFVLKGGWISCSSPNCSLGVWEPLRTRNFKGNCWQGHLSNNYHRQ